MCSGRRPFLGHRGNIDTMLESSESTRMCSKLSKEDGTSKGMEQGMRESQFQ